MQHWHAISNVSGYLPESDDAAYPHDTWEDAQSDLIDQMDRAADFYAMGPEDDRATAALASLEEADRLVRAATRGRDFLTYTDDGGEHTIPTAWQIITCTEDCQPSL